MKLKENKGVSLTGFVIAVLVVLLVVAVAGCVYLLNNPVKEKVAVQNSAQTSQLNTLTKVEENNNEADNNKIALINNNFDATVSMDSYGKEIVLFYETAKTANNNFSENSCTFCYYYTGINKGKLIVRDTKTQKEVEVKTDKKIKDIAGYSAVVGPDSDSIKVGQTISLDSILYILFEDGTVGKIEANKFKNSNYTITEMSEFHNEEYFIELSPIDMGGDNYLFVVDTKGEAKLVGSLTSGD